MVVKFEVPNRGCLSEKTENSNNINNEPEEKEERKKYTLARHGS